MAKVGSHVHESLKIDGKDMSRWEGPLQRCAMGRFPYPEQSTNPRAVASQLEVPAAPLQATSKILSAPEKFASADPEVRTGASPIRTISTWVSRRLAKEGRAQKPHCFRLHAPIYLVTT